MKRTILATGLMLVAGCGTAAEQRTATRPAPGVQQACWWVPEQEILDTLSLFEAGRLAFPDDPKTDALAIVLEVSMERAEEECGADDACVLQTWAAYNTCWSAIVDEAYR